MNSELALFAGYSITGQNASRYLATIGSYLLRIKKKCHFLRKQAKNSKEYHAIAVNYVNPYQNT